MKKSIVIVIVLLTILLCSSAMVVLMATGIIQKGDNTDNGIFIESSENNKSYVRTMLETGFVDITEELEGMVCASQQARTVYEIEKVNKTFKLHTSVGNYVEKGSPLYTDNNGNVVSAQTDVVVTDIISDVNFYMETFSYDDMKIKLYILDKYQNRIQDIVFTTIDENGETIELELSKIDSYVNDGRFGVELKCPFKVFENSTLKIIVKYDTVEGKTTIPIDYILFTKDNIPYVHLLKGEDEFDVEDYYLDVYSYNDEEYIVNDNLGGCWVGYTQEEKYFNEQ